MDSVLGLLDDDLVGLGDLDDVGVPPAGLLLVDRPLPDHHPDLRRVVHLHYLSNYNMFVII